LQPGQGATHTTNREGLQNPLEARITLQAPSHSTNIAGIQNPTMAVANLGQGSATSSTTGGAQNLIGITTTGQNALATANTHGPSQSWIPGQPCFSGISVDTRTGNFSIPSNAKSMVPTISRIASYTARFNATTPTTGTTMSRKSTQNE